MYAYLSKNSREQIDPLKTAEFFSLFIQAEAVRWTFNDFAWNSFEKARLDTDTRVLIRSIAAAEVTTWSAARMFLEGYEDDVDFTQWVSIWLYEETKHPNALMAYLTHSGEQFDESFVKEAREIHPFVKSKIGTLTFNILSEIEASTVYFALSQHTNEPLLKSIAIQLSGDEARHAASFYRYTRKYILASASKAKAQVEVLKALYFWLSIERGVMHPVAMVSRLIASQNWGTRQTADQKLSDNVENRMLGVISSLIGIELNSSQAVMNSIRDLLLKRAVQNA